MLAEAQPDHPGSEATAVSEAIEVVRERPELPPTRSARSPTSCLMHQTVIGLESCASSSSSIDREPDYLVASIGCGSNMGGIAPAVRARTS